MADVEKIGSHPPPHKLPLLGHLPKTPPPPFENAPRRLRSTADRANRAPTRLNRNACRGLDRTAFNERRTGANLVESQKSDRPLPAASPWYLTAILKVAAAKREFTFDRQSAIRATSLDRVGQKRKNEHRPHPRKWFCGGARRQPRHASQKNSQKDN